MITISINKKRSTGEYRVVNSETKDTYYTDNPEDAVQTAITIIEDFQAKGKIAELSTAKYTMDLIALYRPDWLVAEARSFLTHILNS